MFCLLSTDFGGWVVGVEEDRKSSAEAGCAAVDGAVGSEVPGGVGGLVGESLVEHPARMTHASVAGTPQAVDPSLVRLSVGIEAVDDLVADLRRALDGAGA